MICRIKVNGLFGLFDYDIMFPQSPSVKILTGPNGYGKTTLLKIIDHLYSGEFWYFHFLDFREISITLLHDIKPVSIIIKKRFQKSEVIFLKDAKDDAVLDDTDNVFYEEVLILLDETGSVIEEFIVTESYIQTLLIDVRRKSYIDANTMSDEELLSLFYSSEYDYYKIKNCRNISLALQEYTAKYQPAQRIFNRDKFKSSRSVRPLRSYTYEIDYVNSEISRLYRKAQNEFASTSQRIDATYINRLIRRNQSYRKEDLKRLLDNLKKRISAFKQMNLFSNMELLDYSMEDDNTYSEFDKVLSQYIDDMNDKMDRFDVLYKKISLFKNIIVDKVLSEKSINFSDKGLTVINTNGKELTDLHKLSSGEQNLLILYYNLIFNTNSRTILLIDEPENSLHVAWQAKMLDDYISIAENTGCQVVLATHSPTFINGRWEILTDLYKQFNDK